MKKYTRTKSLKLNILLIISLHCIDANSSNSFNLQNLPKPYCDVTELQPFNPHGWYLNAHWIALLFQHNPIVNVVEVGSWLGASTRHIASLLPKDGKLYAVDTWQGSVEINNDRRYIKFLPTLYNQFLSNVIHAGLTDKIIPLKMTSQQAAEELRQHHEQFDLIYIDAAHDTESVLKDLESYFPFVKNHKGILCGDDWKFVSVRIAVLAFAQQNNLTVYGNERANFWFIAEEEKSQYIDFNPTSNQMWKFPKNNSR